MLIFKGATGLCVAFFSFKSVILSVLPSQDQATYQKPCNYMIRPKSAHSTFFLSPIFCALLDKHNTLYFNYIEAQAIFTCIHIMPKKKEYLITKQLEIVIDELLTWKKQRQKNQIFYMLFGMFCFSLICYTSNNITQLVGEVRKKTKILLIYWLHGLIMKERH